MSGAQLRFVRRVAIVNEPPSWNVWLLAGLYGAQGVVGTVQWCAPLRRFAFVPIGSVPLDDGMLRDIAGFLDRETSSKRRETRRIG